MIPGPLPAAVRLLLVGMHNSPHLHRWARMISRPDVAVVIFPVMSFETTLPAGFVYRDVATLSRDVEPGLWVVNPAEIWSPADRDADARLGYTPWSHSFVDPTLLLSPQRLIGFIERLDPQLIHSLELQLAGYACAEVARRIGRRLPPWLASAWGSDVALFRKLPGHAARLSAIFSRAQLYLPDCARDQALARRLGYRGPRPAIIPSSGGMDIAALGSLTTKPPSQRRTLIVKGYHNWAGRALLALSALVLAKERLAGYRIGIQASDAGTARWIPRIAEATGLPVEAPPYLPDHRAVLARLATARAIIGIGISDGIATTVLEAMAVGTFPIQSGTACVDEWIEHGRTGLIVSPHDTRQLAEAIIRAATDDALVDGAAAENLRTVTLRWNVETNHARAWEIYRHLIG